MILNESIEIIVNLYFQTRNIKFEDSQIGDTQTLIEQGVIETFDDKYSTINFNSKVLMRTLCEIVEREINEKLSHDIDDVFKQIERFESVQKEKFNNSNLLNAYSELFDALKSYIFYSYHIEEIVDIFCFYKSLPKKKQHYYDKYILSTILVLDNIEELVVYEILSILKFNYKNTFLKNDLRPEHYFDCTKSNLIDEDQQDIIYTKESQEIRYEINFSQTMVVNTQGSDAFTHAMGRCIDDIVDAISVVDAVTDKLAEVDKMLEDTSISEDQKAALEELKEIMTAEKTLKEKVLQQTFASALTQVTDYQNMVNVAVADLGSRYSRLQLTENRLALEQSDFEDLLSKNEDADIVDTIIKLNSQEVIYNSSLSAASKIVKNTLLDFL